MTGSTGPTITLDYNSNGRIEQATASEREQVTRETDESRLWARAEEAARG